MDERRAPRHLPSRPYISVQIMNDLHPSSRLHPFGSRPTLNAKWTCLAFVSGLLLIGLVWFCLSRRVHLDSVIIDGHKIEFARHGSGSPAVIFLHGGLGGGAGLEVWRGWLTRVDATAFCYSRPGYGKSEPAKDERTPARIADELHTLLVRVGINPPYVLVGGSMGGLYARVFAMRYPRDIAGLVLIDGTHERQWLEGNRLDPVTFPMPSPDSPEWNQPDGVGLTATIKSGRLDVGGKLPDVPMAVITSLHHTTSKRPLSPADEEAWRNLQNEIFQSTTYGMHIVTAKSGHVVQETEAGMVLNAIRWVLGAAQAREISPAKASAP